MRDWCVRDNNRRGDDASSRCVVRFRERQSRLAGSYSPGCHARTGQQLIEYSSPRAQRLIDKEFAVRVENIKNKIGHRDFVNKPLADFFSSEAPLQCAERKRAAVGFARPIQPTPRHNLAVKNHALRKPGQNSRQLRERFRNLVPRPRKEASLSAANVSLRANAVVLILHRRVAEITNRLFRGFHRACQHEIDRVKKSQPCIGQLSRGGQPQRFANVAEQHVGTLHQIDRRVESLRDGLFHQTFLQTDAQVSADDFHDVLGFERHRALEQLPQQSRFGGGATRGRNFGERVLHRGQS